LTGVIDQLGAIGMGTKAVDGHNLRFDVILFAKDLDHGLMLNQPAAEGIGRLPADDEHRVAGVFDVVLQVMQDTAGLGHA